jgi:hypothetical protein
VKNQKNEFFKRLFRRKKQSVWIAVLGKKQSGKTDFSLYIMETLYGLELIDAFGSNVPIKAPFEVDFIEDFNTLEKRCRMLNPDPEKHGLKRYLFFASEMGKWLPKDQSWRNVDFVERLQTVRKYGLSWIGDAISRVDSRALNEVHFEGCFIKLSPTNPTIALYEDWVTGQETTLKNIPRTSIGFDTWYSANFYMEPQTQEDILIPLNPEHKLVKQYLKAGSWAKAGIHPQEGKRALSKVLKFHMSHCLHSIQEPVEDKPVSVAVETD